MHVVGVPGIVEAVGRHAGQAGTRPVALHDPVDRHARGLRSVMVAMHLVDREVERAVAAVEPHRPLEGRDLRALHPTGHAPLLVAGVDDVAGMEHAAGAPHDATPRGLRDLGTHQAVERVDEGPRHRRRGVVHARGVGRVGEVVGVADDEERGAGPGVVGRSTPGRGTRQEGGRAEESAAIERETEGDVAHRILLRHAAGRRGGPRPGTRIGPGARGPRADSSRVDQGKPDALRRRSPLVVGVTPPARRTPSRPPRSWRRGHGATSSPRRRSPLP